MTSLLAAGMAPPGGKANHQGNAVITPLRPHPRAARLETLRREYKAQVIASVASYGRTVRVAAYVLTAPGQERGADLELVSKYAVELGWEVASSTFADVGQPLPLVERPGFRAACRYAAQGYAHGILAIARPAITTDNEVYAGVLEHLYVRSVFLDYLPTVDAATP